MTKIIVKQVRSKINRPKDQKATLLALGLKKMNMEVTHKETPQILGMIKKVEHLVKVIKK
ncbi:MAG: 50S ribosomal protein L30 [Flavobacteriales bacterium]|nr:50S ribosomal protein L30 [Flavobacteriales bacterium]|tara:strand:- start:248 stop:427 length:180 start_codon:yes stop_codon:yes gene_type:complete